MFTGIIEHLGTVTSITRLERDRHLTVSAGPLCDGIAVGDSVAVNGVCLTVVAYDSNVLTFEAMGETLDRTNLGDLSTDDVVNLERPMRADGRFDGHIVQGHVDGVATVRSVTPDGDSVRIRVDLDPSLLRYVVSKGSITLDGVSLTVTDVDDAGLEVAIIPHTQEVTTLGTRSEGERVNVEVDVLAKYVERLVSSPA